MHLFTTWSCIGKFKNAHLLCDLVLAHWIIAFSKSTGLVNVSDLGTYMSISICAAANSVSDKTANEPTVGKGALPDVDVDSEILEKAEVLVRDILRTEGNFTSQNCRHKRKLHPNLI